MKIEYLAISSKHILINKKKLIQRRNTLNLSYFQIILCGTYQYYLQKQIIHDVYIINS